MSTELEMNLRLIQTEKDIKSRTFAVLYLYERPYEKQYEQEEIWLNAMQKAAGEVLGIEESHIIKKMRKHQKGANQYEKKDILASGVQTIQQKSYYFEPLNEYQGVLLQPLLRIPRHRDLWLNLARNVRPLHQYARNRNLLHKWL